MRKVTNMQYTFTGCEAQWYIFIGLQFANFVFPYHLHFTFNSEAPRTHRKVVGRGEAIGRNFKT